MNQSGLNSQNSIEWCAYDPYVRLVAMCQVTQHCLQPTCLCAVGNISTASMPYAHQLLGRRRQSAEVAALQCWLTWLDRRCPLRGAPTCLRVPRLHQEAIKAIIYHSPHSSNWIPTHSRTFLPSKCSSSRYLPQ